MSDLIDREAALKCFHAWVDKYGDVYTPDDTPEYQAIEALPSVQPEQRWIPCSERLPEDHEPKLLTHEVHYITGKVIKDVRMACYDDENDDWLSDEESPEILCYPLAWMPLPEPYGEVDK